MKQGTISGQSLLEAFPGRFTVFYDTTQTASILTTYKKNLSDSLIFTPDVDALNMGLSGKATIVIADEKLKNILKKKPLQKLQKTVLLTKELQVAMALIGKKFFSQCATTYWSAPSIHPTAQIDPTAKVHASAKIGPYTVIGSDVVIKSGVVIGSHNILMNGIHIDADTRMGSHNFISNKVDIGKNNEITHHCNIEKNTIIGDHNIIHAFVFLGEKCHIHNSCEIGEHCTLGSDGFGYGTSLKGHHYKKNHYGKVILYNNVVLGSHNCVDRGTFEDSVIEEGTKTDNFCHFAHNVKIGKHNLVVAGFLCGGSSSTGDHCVFGGRTALVGHISVKDHTTVMASSLINQSLKKPGAYGGFPIQEANKFKKNIVASSRLSEWMQKINQKIKILEEK